jgi:hypothetical protein
MSYIDHAPPMLGSLGAMPAQASAQAIGARLYAERMAQAEAPEPALDHGALIVPLIGALALAGWLLTILAVLYVLAPLAGAAFALVEQFWPATPGEIWHGR